MGNTITILEKVVQLKSVIQHPRYSKENMTQKSGMSGVDMTFKKIAGNFYCCNKK